MKKAFQNIVAAVFAVMIIISLVPGNIHAYETETKANEEIVEIIEAPADMEVKFETEKADSKLIEEIRSPRAAYESWSMLELFAMLFTILSGLFMILKTA